MDKLELTDTQRGWLLHIEACVATGGSMKAYADEQGLDLQSFYLWKGRLKKLGFVAVAAGRHRQATAIMPVALQAPAPRSTKAHTRIEFANGIVIEVPLNVDAGALCDLLCHAMALP
jgi:hypothetical protein